MGGEAAGRLAGKVVLVSGGARGQGAAEVRMFAREGARVVFGDVRHELGEAVAREVRDAGGTADYRALDVRREEDWARAVAHAEERHGRLDALVNNAGILDTAGIEEQTLDSWHDQIAVNQTGPFLGMRAAIPALRRAGGGAIVNISSIAAFVGSAHAAGYAATKGALFALTRSAAIALAPDGIRVNSIHPGVIDTPMGDEVMGDDQLARRAMAATNPLARFGTPDEVAGAVLFLIGDDATFVNGVSLAVDAGSTAWFR